MIPRNSEFNLSFNFFSNAFRSMDPSEVGELETLPPLIVVGGDDEDEEEEEEEGFFQKDPKPLRLLKEDLEEGGFGVLGVAT